MFKNSNGSAVAEIQLDAIFAVARHCSGTIIAQRVRAIVLLVENGDDLQVLQAVQLLNGLIDKLRFIGKGTRLELYSKTRRHLLFAWQWIMRSDYYEALRHLESAAACCSAME